MNLTRPIVFWIAMLAAVIAVIVLLREVLLPFVAGLALAYLLDPLASRIERLGMNRLLATLIIVIFGIITVVVLSVLTLPVIVRELQYFIESFPLYIQRLPHWRPTQQLQKSCRKRSAATAILGLLRRRLRTLPHLSSRFRVPRPTAMRSTLRGALRAGAPRRAASP